MSTEVIVALVTGFFTLAGVILTVVFGNKVIVYRIEQLEKKQDKHNTLIDRMYNAEEDIKVLQERQKVCNHRIDDLEHALR